MDFYKIIAKLNNKVRHRILRTMLGKKGIVALAHERVEMGDVGQIQEKLAQW